MECSGCGACSTICPKNAISMELDDTDFLKPIINKEKCIHCGLCDKVCPTENGYGTALDDIKLFSAFSGNQDIRKTASSGGVGYCLAKKAILEGYKVCGVRYNYDTNCAEHCIIDKVEELDAIKGSKYLQSHSEQAFKELFLDLNLYDKIKYMVFGTPCQISGLKNVLDSRELRSRVILVDIFCHGVPSNSLWKKYLRELLINNKLRSSHLKKIVFRDKLFSWHTYYMNIEDETGKKYIASRDYDSFLQLFTIGTVNQKSCFTCKYRNNTVADIRLGDYWGARYQDNEEGFSMVLIATKIGYEVINSLKQLNIEERPIEERLSQQHTDPGIPQFYSEAFELLKQDAKLKDIINLYETDLERFKWRVKKKIKKLFRL